MKDDRGVMMLMTAVVLIIGFVALAGMTARTGQIPEEIEAQRGQGFLLETEAVSRFLDDVIGGSLPDCDAANLADLNSTLNSLRLELHGRGYGFSWEASCQGTGPTDYHVGVCIADGQAGVQMAYGAAKAPAEAPFNCQMLSTMKWTILV